MASVLLPNKLMRIRGGFGGVFSTQDGDNSGNNDHYRDSGTYGSLTADSPMTFRTQPFLITPAIAVNLAYIKLQFLVGFDASGAANSATGTFKFSNCGIRKYL